jgi:hypothetical protein
VTWIVDIDLLGVDAAEPPDLYEIAFDVTFPGETWCRSLVLVAPDLSYLGEHELVNRGRDELIALIEREGRPVSATVRLSSAGVEVLALAAPGG